MIVPRDASLDAAEAEGSSSLWSHVVTLHPFIFWSFAFLWWHCAAQLHTPSYIVLHLRWAFSRPTANLLYVFRNVRNVSAQFLIVSAWMHDNA